MKKTLSLTHSRAKSVVTLLMACGAVSLLQAHPPAFPSPVFFQDPGTAVSVEKPGERAAEPVRVTVSGEVEQPGSVSFIAGTTMKGLLEAVRPTSKAYIAHADYGYVLQDGDDIHIPARFGGTTGRISLSDDSLLRIRIRSRPKYSLSDATAGTDAPKININRATVEELQTLPRIGPETARRIIEIRHARGGFKKKEDLQRVRGIGRKTYKWIEPLITVD